MNNSKENQKIIEEFNQWLFDRKVEANDADEDDINAWWLTELQNKDQKTIALLDELKGELEKKGFKDIGDYDDKTYWVLDRKVVWNKGFCEGQGDGFNKAFSIAQNLIETAKKKLI